MYEVWELQLNLKKTKYLATGETPRNLEIDSREGIIEYVKEYKYLGVIIPSLRLVNQMMELAKEEQPYQN